MRRARPIRNAPIVLCVMVLALSAAGALSGCTLQQLRGKVVVLDAGHDGGNAAHPADINRLVWIGTGWKACDTTGTASVAGYPEHAFTYDVVSRVARELTAQGARVVLTRTGDTGWGPCITTRAAIGNAARADVAVSVHADGAAAGARGFHVIRPASLAGLTSATYGSSARLAATLRVTYGADTGLPPSTYVGSGTGIVERADLGGLNLSRVPKVLIECGNMRNSADAALISSPAGRGRIGRGIADGIERFLRS